MSELYLFDTSALILFFQQQTASAQYMARMLDESVAHNYHLVTLSELARQSHPEYHRAERPAAEDRARMRRSLLSLLAEHRKTGRQLLLRRRFLPLAITNEQLVLAAELSQAVTSACFDSRGDFQAPCSLADHLIVSAGQFFARRGRRVTIVTGDKHQLEVADRLGLGWVYARGRAKEAERTPYPWGAGQVRWVHAGT
jgi:hypothetical protein